jgi:hypothetical protein
MVCPSLFVSISLPFMFTLNIPVTSVCF